MEIVVTLTDVETNTLETLLERSGKGDQVAFAQLFDELSPRVFRRIRSVLRDESQSEEVMQEVFLEVWQQAARFDATRSNALGWILTRAHSRAVDRVRSAQADRDRDLKIGMRDYAPEYDSVVETIEQRADSDRVIRALKHLSPLQREAVILAYSDGYSHSQLAERLGVPLGTVKSRIHDAMGHLREELTAAS